MATTVDSVATVYPARDGIGNRKDATGLHCHIPELPFVASSSQEGLPMPGITSGENSIGSTRDSSW